MTYSQTTFEGMALGRWTSARSLAAEWSNPDVCLVGIRVSECPPAYAASRKDEELGYHRE